MDNPKDECTKKGYFEIEMHYQRLGKNSDRVVPNICNFLDMFDYRVLLLGEGVYKLYMHCKHFCFIRQSNGR